MSKLFTDEPRTPEIDNPRFSQPLDDGSQYDFDVTNINVLGEVRTEKDRINIATIALYQAQEGLADDATPQAREAARKAVEFFLDEVEMFFIGS